MQNIFTETV